MALDAQPCMAPPSKHLAKVRELLRSLSLTPGPNPNPLTRTLTQTRTRTRTLSRTPTPTPTPTLTLTLPLAKVEELYREGLVEAGCGITADQVELCFDVVSKGYEQYMHAVKTLDLQACPFDAHHACTVLLAP